MSILRYKLNEQYNEMHQLFARRDDPEVREKLILANINLVKLIASRFMSYGEPIEDLVQVGIVGLIRAVELYNPERGIRFSVYATPSISGVIKTHLLDNVQNVYIPRGLLGLCFAAKRAEESLSQSLGRKPTVQEIAEALGASEKEITKALWASEARNTVSLDTGLSGRDGESRSSSELIGEEDSGITSITQNEGLAEAISRLKPNSRRIIELCFLQELKQNDVAKLLSCTRANVFELRKRALRDLRRILDGKEKPKIITTKVKKEPKVKKVREVCNLPPVGERDTKILGVIWPRMTHDESTKLYYQLVSAVSGVPSDQVSQYIRTLVRRGILVRGKGGYKKGAVDVQIRLHGGFTEIKIRPGLTVMRDQRVNLDDIFPSRVSTREQKLNT